VIFEHWIKSNRGLSLRPVQQVTNHQGHFKFTHTHNFKIVEGIRDWNKTDGFCEYGTESDRKPENLI
jgi:hypothetical protein